MGITVLPATGPGGGTPPPSIPSTYSAEPSGDGNMARRKRAKAEVADVIRTKIKEILASAAFEQRNEARPKHFREGIRAIMAEMPNLLTLPTPVTPKEMEAEGAWFLALLKAHASYATRERQVATEQAVFGGSRGDKFPPELKEAVQETARELGEAPGLPELWKALKARGWGIEAMKVRSHRLTMPGKKRGRKVSDRTIENWVKDGAK